MAHLVWPTSFKLANHGLFFLLFLFFTESKHVDLHCPLGGILQFLDVSMYTSIEHHWRWETHCDCAATGLQAELQDSFLATRLKEITL